MWCINMGSDHPPQADWAALQGEGIGSVKLSSRDKQILDGRQGEAARMAMRIVTRMAEVVGARELMDISQAHIDGCGLLSESGLEFAETLAAKGAEVSVPATLNMGPLDLQNWRKFGVDEVFARKAIRQAEAYIKMGCVPTWSCAPYQGYLAPRFGQQIAWGESNAICYANSVLGARTNRYGDFMDICAAITGRVPKCGLHLKENRRGQVLVRLSGIEHSTMHSNVFYPVFGHLLGSLVQDRIPVIEGLPKTATSDQLKALCAAAASSGALALFHAVGLTPEAGSLEEAFGPNQPEEVIEIGRADLEKAWDQLSTATEGEKLDLVVLGCPHFSFGEFRELADLISRQMQRGRRLHSGLRFIVTSCQMSYGLAERAGLLDVLTDFGVEITLDTCVFHTPIVRPDAKVVMTNSGKCSYYAPGELDVRVAFGTMNDCVASAVAGRVCREEGLWGES